MAQAGLAGALPARSMRSMRGSRAAKQPAFPLCSTPCAGTRVQHAPRPQQQQQHPGQRHLQPRSSARRPVQVAASSGGAAAQKRRLILLRHADSEQSASVRDHDRPISSQGLREAASISARLADLGWLPDLILASNSARTRQTLDAMIEADVRLGQADAHYLGSLYTVAALDGQTRQHIEHCIRSMATDGDHGCVMCVAHNKGLEQAASSWARGAVRLDTACAALFEAAGRSWEEALAPDVEWRLVEVVTP